VPRKKLPMRKITEVLRLNAQGMSQRQIALSAGISKTAVREYLSRAEKAEVGWPLPEGMTAKTLEAALYPPPVVVPAALRPVPDWRAIHRELKRKDCHVTLRLLWLEWKEANPSGWRYSRFCYHYAKWLESTDVVMRLSYGGGERMFVDFCGDKAPAWVHPASGEVHRDEVFVSVLGASGMIYAEAVDSQGLECWLMAHIHAWESYGGVAQITVPDNLKAGVRKACYYDPEINPSYAELAFHYDTVVLPARPGKPRDKAAAESGVMAVERWVLAPLRNRSFYSRAELNEAIAGKVAELNARAFRGEPTSRGELFAELEAPFLRPLPARRYEFARWRQAKVHIDYHLDAGDGHFYSVPYRYARAKVEVRLTSSTIEVFKDGERIASHARERGRRRYVTDPAHMPKSHRAHLEWSPQQMIDWAASTSQSAAELMEKLLASRPHPEHAYRAGMGIMALARRYGPERFEAACARAVASGAISYSSVKSILTEGLDRLPLPEAQPVPEPPDHHNLRGAGYYFTEEGEQCL
jgi:transposase